MRRLLLLVVLAAVGVTLTAAGQNPPATAPPSGSSQPGSVATPTSQPGGISIPSTQPASPTVSQPPSPPAGDTGSGTIDSNDPLLQPPPLPKGNPSLIGGTISKVDRVRETVTVRPFGGNNMKVYFDERTHIFRDGVETTMLGLRKGDRVYVDTLLDGSRVFAKNIRVESHARPADARGQIVSYRDGRLEMRDNLSTQPVSFSVTNGTVIHRGDQSGTLGDLRPGALVDVHFAPESPGKGVAQEITIYAMPGSVFTFQGQITYLDMSRGVLAVHNQANDQTYDIHFNPQAPTAADLGVGAQVKLVATFDGSQYTAQNIDLQPTEKAEKKDK